MTNLEVLKKGGQSRCEGSDYGHYGSEKPEPTQFAYSMQLEAGSIIESCRDWIESCRISGFEGGFDTMKIVRVLNKRWTRNSVGSSVGKTEVNKAKFPLFRD